MTVTQTETRAVGLPGPVARTHAGLLAAAEAGDYEALEPFIGERFSATFGGPIEGGPTAYWRELERAGASSPIRILERILRLPYTLSRGIYVWPFAYDKQPEELTDHERELLGDLVNDFAPGTGYLGWRAGIEPDGDWIFFIAGD